MAVLPSLQELLEKHHDVAIDLDVRAYVIDPATRADIPGALLGLPEQLFIRQAGDEVELALFIEPQILELLERDPPCDRLHGANLEPFCIALEGVSHFILVAWRARVGRPVTGLELEVQAEVDKFAVSWLLLEEQGVPLWASAPALERALFVATELRDDLGAEEAGRYLTATRAARDFCRHLTRRHARGRDLRAIRRDLRTYFRTGLDDKLRAA
jgi:hypothetical protein